MTTSPLPTKVNYPWTRFWSDRTDTLDLSDYGFLVDPTNQLSLSALPRPKTYEEIAGYRAVVFLGEPGMGKSWVLASLAQRTPSGDGGQVSLRADLRAFSTENLLYKRIFEHQIFAAWLKNNTHLTLYLDSLDEALLRIDTIAAFLAAELPQLPTDRLSIRIACRTALWPSATLERALEKIWGEKEVKVVELAPLRRIDVIDAAKLQSIDPEQFISAIFDASAVPFAIKPLTLNLLFDLFKRDGRLPRSILELYRSGCLTLCEESNDARREAGRLGALNGAQRFRLAARIASTTMFANRYAIWTGSEGSGVPEEDVGVSALAGDREEGDFIAFDVTEANVREVLDTGLFTSRGAHRMGWAHQGYAEFLAALYMVEKGLTPGIILKILLHPSGGLVPQLGVVAAWVAALSKPVRDALVSTEPLTLLRGDLSSWSDDDVAALTASLLKALDERRTNDAARDISLFYGRLKHSGLADQLRPYLTDRSRHMMSRRAAIMIAEHCAVKGLRDELLDLALDQSDDPTLRAYAMSALRKCGDKTAIEALLPVAKGELGDDPDDEMLGYALRALWPDYLSAAELFPLLVHPNESFFGSYSYFLSYELLDSLEDEGLPIALEWARDVVSKSSHNNDFKRKSLADKIFIRAWGRLAQPAVLEAVLDYTESCLAQSGDLLRGTDHRENEAFHKGLQEDAASRAVFLRGLVKRKIEPLNAFYYIRAGLLQASDLSWLLDAAPGGSATDVDYNEQSLLALVAGVADFKDGAQFEQLYAAAQEWPALYERFFGVFEGVPLDSNEAHQGRAMQEQMEGFKEKKRPVLSPLPADRVAQALGKFEAGRWRSFYVLNIELTLEPNSTGYWTERTYLITSMPGWRNADPSLRDRIVKAAQQYLIVGKTHVQQFIGRRQARSDAAAFRALILLKEQDAAAYERVSQPIWEKWAAGIAYLTQDHGDSIPQIQADVYLDALNHAPKCFVWAIQRLIRAERRSLARSGTKAAPGTSFYKLREIKRCLANSQLCEMLFTELKDPGNTPDQFSALLGALLDGQYPPARAYVIDSLASGKLAKEFATAAVNALIAFDVGEAWFTIWGLISSDKEFGRITLLELAGRYSYRQNLFNMLDEHQLAELYVLLEKLFPRTEDVKHEGAHLVAPADSIRHVRDGIPRRIEAFGTPEAVAALRWIVGQLPELDWLSFHVQNAEQLMRMRTWSPLSPVEIRKLFRSSKTTLIQTADDLGRVVIGTLREYERRLHGEQTPVRGLWDRQDRGDTYMPVEEDVISDDVKLFLQRELAESGIIANREVEVGRLPGARLGKRTDIKIDAVRRGPNGGPADVITAVIETKGCWNPGLFPALKTQLFEAYMVPLSAPVGVYLVAWFDKQNWNTTDPRRRQTPDIGLKEVQERLDYDAAAIPTGYQVLPIVLDCHLPAK